MAIPMSAAAFLRALKAEGLTVVEVGDWPSHNRNSVGSWGPVHGVMIHHTVTKGAARTVDICRTGYEGLPGPLCHGVITKDGRVHLVGYGRANHAGLGDDDVLRAVIAEQALPAANEANTDGNPHFYGFECENLGDGDDPWPDAQVEAIVRVSAAISRHHGWNERSVIGHKEWQPGKVDPRGVSMDTIRHRMHERLEHSADWDPNGSTDEQENNDMSLSADDVKKIFGTDGAVPAARPPAANADYDDGNRAWTAGYALQTTVEGVRKTQQAVGALTAKVDTLTVLVNRLLAANPQD